MKARRFCIVMVRAESRGGAARVRGKARGSAEERAHENRRDENPPLPLREGLGEGVAYTSAPSPNPLPQGEGRALLLTTQFSFLPQFSLLPQISLLAQPSILPLTRLSTLL